MERATFFFDLALAVRATMQREYMPTIYCQFGDNRVRHRAAP
jgi:hypothetical protein